VKTKRIGGWFLVSLLVFIADQATKWMAQTHLDMYQPYPVLPMFNLTLAYNTGAAFSFLSQAGAWHRWFFAGISVVMSGFFIVWLIRLPSKATLQALALSLILGGTIGNGYDRLLSGHVVDFIQLYYHQFYWPVFNIADSAICVGAFLLLLDLLRTRD
jgi:signal peptidase II